MVTILIYYHGYHNFQKAVTPQLFVYCGEDDISEDLTTAEITIERLRRLGERRRATAGNGPIHVELLTIQFNIGFYGDLMEFNEILWFI